MKENRYHIPLQIISLLAAAAVCVYLSLPYLNSLSFWVDEVYTYGLMQKSWGGMLAETMADVHPPLYYIILRLFISVFGATYLNYRLASFLPYLILSLTAAFSFRKRLGYFPALLFILLSGLMPAAMTYNAEARMYSWALLFVTLCGYALFLILSGGGRGAWVLFTLMGLGAAYTHYYAFLSVCLLYFSLLVATLAQKKPLRGWLICVGASLLGYLPWLLPFLTTLGRTAGDFWLTGVPSLLNTLQILYNDHIAGLLLLALSFAAPLLYLFTARSVGMSAKHWLAAAMGITAIGTLCIAYAASALVRPLFLTRYFYPCCGLVWLCFGLAVQELGRRWKWLHLLSMAAIVVLALDCFWKPYTGKKNELIEVNNTVEFSVNYVNDRAKPGDILCSTVGYTLSSNGLSMYFAGNPNLTVVEYEDGQWLQPGHSTFLFTPELGYLQDDAQAAVDAAGFEVAESHGVGLEAGFHTVYHLVPAE